jgi:chemotaxis protein MotB
MGELNYKELEAELLEAQAELEEISLEPEAQEETEGVWLISYADLMTLLMGFFALMTSMADFNEEKFAQVGEEIAEFTGGKVDQPFAKVGESIEKLIKEQGLEEQVDVIVKKTNVQIHFTGQLLFESGSFAVRNEATGLMTQISEILYDQVSDKKVLIEGHTDSVPISRGIIASNWELSSLRANAVARLFESQGFTKSQILTIGLGETRPIVKEGEKVDDAQNRRVVIKIMNQHPI